MEEFLTNLYTNSTSPIISAFLLGLMTAISPCPLATNITAIGYLSKNIENKNRVFYNGIVYTLGRAFSYTGLAFLLYTGADQFNAKGFFEQYGERIIGPLLISIGLIMLDILKINILGFSKFSEKFQKRAKYNYLDVVFLGIIFALAFCPYSGILYFGLLIPMTIQSVAGLYLPVIFAIATGIPVIIFAWLLAFTVSGVGKLYNNLKLFEIWFRRIISVVFIGIGIYYIFIIWF